MKIIYLLPLLSVLSFNLYCQTEWTKYPGNPVMLPGSAVDWDKEFIGFGTVIYHNNNYHMWYTGDLYPYGGQIGHATSDDGIIWTKDINNPVLDGGTEGSWEESGIGVPSVMVIDGTLHIWYSGHRGNLDYFDFQVGHATSPDGITWTKDPNNPVLPRGPEGTWDNSWVYPGSVLYDGKQYHMWYGGCDTLKGVRIGHATSPDGLTWTKDPSNPVLETLNPLSWDFPRVDFPTVIFDGTTYHMWHSGGDLFKSKIGYATSEDGSVWMKYPSNPVMNAGSAESWDSRSVSPMSVMDSSGVKYKMWYWGSQALRTASIGYAESTCCPWTSIDDGIMTELSIYPNPAKEVLTIETDRSGLYTIEITTLSGQLLYSAKMVGPVIQLNLSSFQKGLYFLTIRSRNYVRTEKIVKM
jgi:predicted GH43/DUF377 family glycosyl hydrolase